MNQLIGLPEVVLQTLAFGLLLVYWYHHPGPWWNRIMPLSVGRIVIMGVSGWLAALGYKKVSD